MRFLLPLLLVGVLFASAPATACSLLYEPWKDARWEDELTFVNGDRLTAIRDGQEITIADGVFLSYATHEGHFLVAGQTGLGADCSGNQWLKLVDGDGDEVWHKDGQAQVWHRMGATPVARLDGQYFELIGSTLKSLDVGLPADAHVLDWLEDGTPVVQHESFVVAGERQVSTTGWVHAAHHMDTFALLSLEVSYGDGAESATAHLNIVGREQTNISWQTGFGTHDLVHSDAWWALSGERAYRIGADVQDLGPAQAIGVRAAETIIFRENAFTVYDGTTPVESWQRVQGVWIPSQPAGEPAQPVQHTRSTTIPPPNFENKESPDLGLVIAIGLLVAGAFLRIGKLD